MTVKKGYYSLKQVLEASIGFEQESAEFYRGLKAKTGREDAQTLLALLEQQELEHKRKLETFVENPEMGAVFIQFPPELELSMPVLKKEDPTLAELIELAIKRETMSAEIYEKSAVRAPAPLKALLSGLAAFERVHERNLKELKLQ